VYYVYLIESLSADGERYVGMTTDLKQRLREHNQGKSSHTTKFSPWKLTTYIAFTDRGKAEAFERYLKSGQVTLSPESASGNRYPKFLDRYGFSPLSQCRAVSTPPSVKPWLAFVQGIVTPSKLDEIGLVFARAVQ